MNAQANRDAASNFSVSDQRTTRITDETREDGPDHESESDSRFQRVTDVILEAVGLLLDAV